MNTIYYFRPDSVSEPRQTQTFILEGLRDNSPYQVSTLLGSEANLPGGFVH